MTRGILIAGNESSLFNAIVAEASKRVDRLAAAPIPNRSSTGEREKLMPVSGRPLQLLLPWSPSNPIGARGLILAAENRLERIDEAILICSPPPMKGAAASLNAVDIETAVNLHIKGWFFLVKELSALFKTRKAGLLALAAPEITPGNREALPDLLGSSAIASFRTLAQGLLSSSFEEPYQTIGFSTAEPGEEPAFAAFIFKIIEEAGRRNTGKWHKFGKLNLFNR